LVRQWEWSRFNQRVLQNKQVCLSKIIQLKETGKSIAAFGAAAKGSTWLNYLGLKSDVIEYVIDETLYKQGKFMPGSRIPIVSPNILREKNPDYLVILPWNFQQEISKRARDFGFTGKFLYRHGDYFICQ
jgi:hypothetical protein